jgi:hypothetical protein
MAVKRTAGIAAGVGLLLAALVVGEVWAQSGKSAGDPGEYPADLMDQPPAAVAFDPNALASPGCPTGQPDRAPTGPGQPGDEKLVEWGAVRLVRCGYFAGPASDAVSIDVIEDARAVTDAARVLRRMLTAEQFSGYFGGTDGIAPASLLPSYRYLFQFPDGHVTEVDYRDGYYRGGIIRFRWSVRGTSIAPLAAPGTRTCGPAGARPCQITGTTATLPA